MSPAEFKACSVWEFQAAVDGWVASNTSDEAMTEAEADELWDWLQSKPDVVG